MDYWITTLGYDSWLMIKQSSWHWFLLNSIAGKALLCHIAWVCFRETEDIKESIFFCLVHLTQWDKLNLSYFKLLRNIYIYIWYMIYDIWIGEKSLTPYPRSIYFGEKRTLVILVRIKSYGNNIYIWLS